MDHLTPDVLAAWMENALSPTERSAAEAHAADCAHCQAVLAAMARTAPAAPKIAWWTSASARWLIPVAAAMVVVFVLVGVNRDRRAMPQPANTVSSAPEARRELSVPPVARAEPQATITATDSVADAKPQRDNSRARADTSFGGRQSAKARAAAGVAGQRNRVDAFAPEGAASPISTAAELPPASTPPPPPPAPPAAPQAVGGVAQSPSSPARPAAAPAEPTPTAPLPIQESVTVTSDTATAKTAARGAAAAAIPRPVEVISPERTFRWRAVTPGSILYSMDAGTSWRTSFPGTSVPLHAGSAPSRSVCWLVGQAGTVLLTLDGQNWQVRPFPERVDLTDVRASDARNATVTTADRRRFATADGGATWSPLQEN